MSIWGNPSQQNRNRLQPFFFAAASFRIKPERNWWIFGESMRTGESGMTDQCCCVRQGNWSLFSKPGNVPRNVLMRNAGGKGSLFTMIITRSAWGESKVTYGAFKVTHPSTENP